MSSPNGTGNRGNDRERYVPEEILAVTANRINRVRDYIAFRSVCRSWRSAATFDNFDDTKIPRVPWLLYAYSWLGVIGWNWFLGYRVLITNTIFLDLETLNTWLTGFPSPAGIPYLSWRGWIRVVSYGSVNISLTDFIVRENIVLPGLDTFPGWEHQDGNIGFESIFFIKKMVLSGSPTIVYNFVVMVIWGTRCQLGFYRNGDPSWTEIDPWEAPFCDITYHNRKLYAVDARMRVVECDVHGPNPLQLRQVFILPEVGGVVRQAGSCEFIYLAVASSGKFLIVFEYLSWAVPVAFRVFEFDLMDGSNREIHNLGNKAIFLGLNSSICMDIPASSNVRPNCIYFTNILAQHQNSRAGAYEFSTMTIAYFVWGPPHFFLHPGTWVVPSF